MYEVEISSTLLSSPHPLRAIVLTSEQRCRWRKTSALVKSYLGNALHLLANLAEEHTAVFILRRLRASVILLLPFESLQRKYLKLVLGLFGTSSSRRVRLQVRPTLSPYVRGAHRGH